LETFVRLSRLLPAALLLAGLVAMMTAVACGGGGGDDQEQTQAAPTETETATATPSPTSTPRTPTATPTPTPTPTPQPYQGKVLRLKLPRFGIDAPIEELAINAAGELDTPRAENTAVAWYYIYDRPGAVNVGNSGWYTIGGRTEEVKHGNAVFSAHVYYHSIPAPFKDLAKSQPGDTFVIVMEDGREYTYEFVRYTRYDAATIPMGEIIWPSDKPADEEWITMITCGGRLAGQDYLDREVVVAKRKV
jgi:hypothetical protein